MARARRTLDRKALRAENEAAERRKSDEDPDETEPDSDEAGDSDDDETEPEADAEAAEATDSDEEPAEDEDGEPKPKKKKKAPPKKRAPTKPRTRTAKVVRMKVVWTVFSNSHQVIEEFPYPQRAAAETLMAKLNTDKKTGHPFFLQPVKKPMDKE